MIPKRVMLSVLATTDASGIRVAEFRGAEHTVIPCVALVEGVLWPANSPHPELALAEEFGRFPEGWNGSPIVYDHPKVNGVHVAASSPDILEDNAFGQLFNTVLEDGKLKTELWIDNALVANLSEEAQAQIELLKSGDSVVEVSTGLFMMSEMVEGDFDGEHYDAIWRNIVPDHLAILPPGVPGACSIEDGCGAPRTNTEFVPSMRAASLNINAEDCDCTVVGNAEDPDTQKSLFESLMALGGKFLNFVGAAEHLSDGDIRAALNGALAVVEDQYTFIVSVFSSNDKGTFVYEVGFGDGLFERTFKIKNNKITIGDDAVMVRPETKFVPVEIVTNEANSTTQENAMNKDELVTGLIANDATQFTVDDKDFLDGLTEDQLQKMAPVANEEATPGDGTAAGAGVVERTAADLLSPAPEAEVVKPVTTEDYIADAPPEVQQILNSGLKMHRARKDALITALTANSRNQFTKEQLESKDVTELENIVALASDISYAGNAPVQLAGLQNNSGDDPDAIPAAPTVFDLAPKNADAA